MDKKITQEEVWESQKRFYDTITGLIYGVLIALFIICAFLVVAYQNAVPAKTVEPSYNKMLRVLVESNLLKAGYVELNYFLSKIYEITEKTSEFEKLKISEIVDLDKCVAVNFDRGYITTPLLYISHDFTVDDYLKGVIPDEIIYCKKDAYIFKGGE